MKVLMTVDAASGLWTYALELAAAVALRDVHVVLACMGPSPSGDQLRRASTLENLSLRCADYKLEWMQQPWEDLERAADWLRELCVAEDASLLHLNGYVHAALDWPCPVMVVAHSCVVSWWRAVRGCEPPPSWDEYRARVTNGLHAARAVVASTQAFSNQLQQIYAPCVPCSVIHNGRVLPRRVCGSRRLPLVLAAGSLGDQAKNLNLLDEVASNVQWRIVAAGSAAGNAAGNAGTPAEPRHLECLGPLSPIEMAGWMRQASIFVHPALYEPFGLAVLEAAAAGCALVLADIPVLRELWEGAAVFVDPHDAQAWTEALAALIRAPIRLTEHARSARLRAREFSSDRMGTSYAALYRQLLEEPSGASFGSPAHACATAMGAHS